MDKLVELRLTPLADVALRARTLRRGDLQRLVGDVVEEGIDTLRRDPKGIYQHAPYSGSKTFPTTVRLDEEVVHELKELSKENGRTMRETINAMILWWFEEAQTGRQHLASR